MQGLLYLSQSWEVRKDGVQREAGDSCACLSVQMSLPATATTTPIPATTPCHSAPRGPHPPTRSVLE